MRSDSEIERDVEHELEWSPDFDQRDVAVKVNAGVVLLTGFVRNYYEKHQAERAVKRVKGVIGVANDIEVLPAGRDAHADPDIVRDAVAAVKLALPVAWKNIKIVVSHGQLTLEGSTEWYYQKQRAEDAVRHLTGVRALTNFISINVVRTRSEFREQSDRGASILARFAPMASRRSYGTISTSLGV